MKFIQLSVLALLILAFTSCGKEKRFKIDTEPTQDVSACRATFKASGENGGSKKISEKGFCYSTTNNVPTLSDNTIVSTNGFVNLFEAQITELTANTHYYVRAYEKFTDGDVVYGDVEEFTTNGEYVRGDTGPGKGIIFGVSLVSEGKFVEALLTSAPQLPWGCSNTEVSGVSINLNGRANTDLIVKNCGAGTAAEFCYNLDINGKSDWYLPSAAELSTIYNLSKEMPNFFPKIKYWSSNQWDATKAPAVDFAGSSSLSQNFSKASNFNVIAVRAFD